MRILRRRKIRKRFKRAIKRSTSLSSKFYDLVTHYKPWYVNYIHREQSFFSKYFKPKCPHVCKNTCYKNFTSIISNKLCCASDEGLSKSTVIKLVQSPVKTDITCFGRLQARYNISARNISLSSDVELNPGPRITYKSNRQELMSLYHPDYLYVFIYRLLRYTLLKTIRCWWRW